MDIYKGVKQGQEDDRRQEIIQRINTLKKRTSLPKSLDDYDKAALHQLERLEDEIKAMEVQEELRAILKLAGVNYELDKRRWHTTRSKLTKHEDAERER